MPQETLVSWEDVVVLARHATIRVRGESTKEAGWYGLDVPHPNLEMSGPHF